MVQLAAPAQGGVKGESPNEQHGNFDCVRRVTMDYAPGMRVEKWVSRVTGLTILWANFESESRPASPRGINYGL